MKELGRNDHSFERRGHQASRYPMLEEQMVVGEEMKAAGLPIKTPIDVLREAIDRRLKDGKTQVIFVLGRPLDGKSLTRKDAKRFILDALPDADIEEATFEQGLGKNLKVFGQLWRTWMADGFPGQPRGKKGQEAERRIKRLYHRATSFIEEKTAKNIQEGKDFIFIETPGMLAEIANPQTGAINVDSRNPWNDGDSAIYAIFHKLGRFKDMDYDSSAIVVYATDELRAEFIEQRVLSAEGATPMSVVVYEHRSGLDVQAKNPQMEAGEKVLDSNRGDPAQIHMTKRVKAFLDNLIHAHQRFVVNFAIPLDRIAVVLNYKKINPATKEIPLDEQINENPELLDEIFTLVKQASGIQGSTSGALYCSAGENESGRTMRLRFYEHDDGNLTAILKSDGTNWKLVEGSISSISDLETIRRNLAEAILIEKIRQIGEESNP